MAARTFIAVLLLLSAGLAGCFSGDEPTDQGPQVNESKDPATDMPDGRDGKLIAFEETNKTETGVGGVDHHHDMWDGQNRIVIFETNAAMEPYPDEQNRAYAEFRPPQQNAEGKPALIFEATAAVEFTISNPERRACPYGGTLDGEYVCTDYGTGTRLPDLPAGGGSLKLRYKHAATTTWIDAGDLAWGTPLSIKVTDPRQTDMPHATSSLWEFQVVSSSSQDVTLTFDAKAELVRGEADIPMWPGHPDFYAEKPTRVVVDVADAMSCDSAGCTAGEAEEIVAQKLISYGTRTLHVWVNITSVSMPNPATAPATWFLYHINATGRDNVTTQFDETNYPVSKTNLYWVLPVDDNGMDSPYADGSRWWFRLGGSLITPDNPTGHRVSCYENCADWSAKYSIVVHATNQVEAPETYHYYCLRDHECPGTAA